MICFVNHIFCIDMHAAYYFGRMGLSQEEEDEVILESEKDAARRAFQALLEREGSFPESSDSSSEEEPDSARAAVGPAHVEEIRLPDSIRNRYTFLELLHENHGRRVYFCSALDLLLLYIRTHTLYIYIYVCVRNVM